MQLLPIGQLAYNNAIIKMTPVPLFSANYGFHPATRQILQKFAKITWKTLIKVEQMQILYDKLQKNIRFFNYRAAHYYNKKKSRGPIFLKENKVYLLQKNIKAKQLSKKLDHIKLKSFKIKAIKKPLNYKLKLLPQMKIYLIFHIIYLKPADKDTSLKINLFEIDFDN